MNKIIKQPVYTVNMSMRLNKKELGIIKTMMRIICTKLKIPIHRVLPLAIYMQLERPELQTKTIKKLSDNFYHESWSDLKTNFRALSKESALANSQFFSEIKEKNRYLKRIQGLMHCLHYLLKNLDNCSKPPSEDIAQKLAAHLAKINGEYSKLYEDLVKNGLD